MSKKEYLIEKGLFSITLLMVLIICLVVTFVVIEAIPAFDYYGVFNFIFNTNWAPDNNQFGIFPMIVGSIVITAIALIIAVPLSLFCAIFLEEIASVRLKNYFMPIIQTLAGIPSVIYGFFGLTLIAPIIRNVFGGSGFSILTASIVLALMITPTIISLSQDAIKSVPNYYREASLGLGSTQWQCIKSIIFPVALPGIITAIILGIARAIGETLAILMLAGNVSSMPSSIISPIRTLTSNIALEMGYATEIHYNALFATAIILFIVIMCLMIVSTYVQNKCALKEVI
ncbi:phosphate ABC transporter permease subunit PstC [Methanobrevibacter sp.]|uniref:phosphate ABC transporter permease subunit PstC n=1 Tax=Methanobrevibacter sp. TaxID=66852 RepID=UPI00388EFC88